MSTRYSMRLRTRGTASSDVSSAATDNDATSSAAASIASRRALGNISNREGSETDGQNAKPTKRGRSTAARAAPQPQAEEDDGKPPAPARRASSRRASAKAAAEKISCEASGAKNKATITAAAKKVAAAAKAAKAKAAATKKGVAAATKKGGGAKRKSNDASKPATKRAKKSDSAASTKGAKPAARRSVRSRSTARTKKATAAAVPMREIKVAILPPPLDSDDSTHRGRNVVVPQDFGLQRDSFEESGHNFTYGIAHYDAEAKEREDPLRCKDYVTDMFQHLYHAETEAHPKPYMDGQEDITPKMRAILVDWLVEVHMKFRLVPETLYLCVHILDRYCAIAHVERSKLQLVGVTALFLACKHEEIYPPEVRDCVYITDRAYDRQEVLDMEQTILRILDWKVSLPTAYPFLDRFLSLTKASKMTRHAAEYYMERTLQEHDLLEYRPSLVCASVVILALNNPDVRLHEEEYERELPGLPKILMEYTGFDHDDLMACMTIVAAKVCEPAICASRRHLTAVRKKYEHSKYMRVASMLEDPSVRYVRENIR